MTTRTRWLAAVIASTVVVVVAVLVWRDDASPAADSANGPAEAVNLIRKGGAEMMVDGQPVDWVVGGWGTNDRAVDLSTNAHSGSAALHVRVTSYNDADAKWLSAPITVTPGARYDLGYDLRERQLCRV